MVHQSAKLDFLLDETQNAQLRETQHFFPSSVLPRRQGDGQELESKEGEAFELVPKPTSRSEKFNPEGVLLIHGNRVLWVQRVSATGCHPTLLCSHRVHFPSKSREGQGRKEETKVGSSKTALERLSKKPGNLLAWG